VHALVFPPDGSGRPRGLREDGFEIALEPGIYSICTAVTECRPAAIRAGETTTVEAKTVGPDDHRGGS
jgi:hypothetical protein